MALVPLFIHYSSSLAELIAGTMKGFEVSTLLVPSFTLPTFGTRSTYTTMPKNRNDIFDVAIVGAVLPFENKNTLYNILDLFSKNFYGLFLYFYIKNKEFK
jgi:hypothetical protein